MYKSFADRFKKTLKQVDEPKVPQCSGEGEAGAESGAVPQCGGEGGDKNAGQNNEKNVARNTAFDQDFLVDKNTEKDAGQIEKENLVNIAVNEKGNINLGREIDPSEKWEIPLSEKSSDKVFSKKDFLIEKSFCYGCERFTVDAPETSQERWWCLRRNGEPGTTTKGGENYDFVFKPIRTAYRIGDCPIVKDPKRTSHKLVE